MTAPHGSAPDRPQAQARLSDRFFQALLIFSTLAFCWLAMMAVHELGHVLGAWLTGGTVAKVVLHPLAISRTDLSHNPHPLPVAWAGPALGCALPLAFGAVARATARAHAYLAVFFAGFCLVANGAYLAADAFLRGGDGRELILHGTPPWALVALGLPAVGAGLYLWNGLGPHFGLGPARGKVDRRAAVGASVALAVIVVLEVVLSDTQ
jgi:hypothetical protein